MILRARVVEELSVRLVRGKDALMKDKKEEIWTWSTSWILSSFIYLFLLTKTQIHAYWYFKAYLERQEDFGSAFEDSEAWKVLDSVIKDSPFAKQFSLLQIKQVHIHV